MTDLLDLNNIRGVLIRQEETIIFSLIERAQFALNNAIYQSDMMEVPGFEGSFCDYMLYSTECVHAKARRYSSPDEYPFYNNLPAPVIERMQIASPLINDGVNINDKIKDIYINTILPYVCENADDGHYGSSAVADVNCLQALSKRIHYGKFVAESKFRSDESGYRKLIDAGDNDGIMAKLTKKDVEEKLLKRVYKKACAYGQDPECDRQNFKVDPEFIRDVYEKWLIPLTKDVELEYLLLR